MDTVLVEADEFDRSFLQLHPALACITSIDADHLDIYGTEKEVKAAYQQFHKQISTTSIVEKSIPFGGLTYSIYEEADYSVSKYKPENLGTDLTCILLKINLLTCILVNWACIIYPMPWPHLLWLVSME